MSEIGVEIEKPIQLLLYNKSTINLANNPISHGKSKHIEPRYHFLREQVNNGKLKLIHCLTQLQLADFFYQTFEEEEV